MSKRKSSVAAEQTSADSPSTPIERDDVPSAPTTNAARDHAGTADAPAPAPDTDSSAPADDRNGEPTAPPSDAIHAGPRWSFPPPEGLSLEDRVCRLEDVVATLQQSHPQLLGPADNWRTSSAGESEAAPSTNRYTEQPATPPGRQWLWFEVYAELRCIVRMITDPRYRMTWSGKVMPIVFIFGLVLSWWVISDIPVVGGVLDRIFSIVLAYLLFKALGREATRYRQTSPDLPPGLKL